MSQRGLAGYTKIKKENPYSELLKGKTFLHDRSVKTSDEFKIGGKSRSSVQSVNNLMA
jgi:hypothetical protein